MEKEVKSRREGWGGKQQPRGEEKRAESNQERTVSVRTSVEAKEAFVAQHLLGTVKAVLVHELSYEGAGGALVLHTGLHQVNGVHSRRTRG